jgi:tetratricopeptide (TPR) repeat protein
LGKLNLARKSLFKALLLYDENTDYWIEAARIFAEEGRHQLAEKAYKIVLQWSPKVEDWIEFIDYLAIRKKHNLAIKVAKLSQYRLTDDFEIFYKLGCLYEQIGDFPKSVKYFRKAQKISPSLFKEKMKRKAGKN